MTDVRGKSCSWYYSNQETCGYSDDKGKKCEQMYGQGSEDCEGDFEAEQSCCACKSQSNPSEQFCCNYFQDTSTSSACELYIGTRVVGESKPSYAYTFEVVKGGATPSPSQTDTEPSYYIGG